MSRKGLLEDYGAVAVDKHPVLQVPPHRAGEDAPLDLAPEADEILGGVAVGYVGDVLVDDGPRVEILRDVVGGRADRLHAPLVSPAVGVGPGEGGQEGVVDVDDAARIGFDKAGGEDLHVASAHHEVDAALGEQAQNPRLLLGLGLLRDGKVIEGDTVALGARLQVGVVGDDERYLRLELPRVPTPEEIYQAVVVAGDQYRHPLGRVG